MERGHHFHQMNSSAIFFHSFHIWLMNDPFGVQHKTNSNEYHLTLLSMYASQHRTLKSPNSTGDINQHVQLLPQPGLPVPQLTSPNDQITFYRTLQHRCLTSFCFRQTDRHHCSKSGYIPKTEGGQIHVIIVSSLMVFI